MPGKRPQEPIAPTTIPGEPLDPKIPPDEAPPAVEEPEDETDDDLRLKSEAAFDRAIVRTPPG